jgi:hypothetical protein
MRVKDNCPFEFGGRAMILFKDRCIGSNFVLHLVRSDFNFETN